MYQYLYQYYPSVDLPSSLHRFIYDLHAPFACHRELSINFNWILLWCTYIFTCIAACQGSHCYCGNAISYPIPNAIIRSHSSSHHLLKCFIPVATLNHLPSLPVLNYLLVAKKIVSLYLIFWGLTYTTVIQNRYFIVITLELRLKPSQI